MNLPRIQRNYTSQKRASSKNSTELSRRKIKDQLLFCWKGAVGSEDFGESLNGHGETGNGPDADVEHFPTTEKKGSLSYADAARGTKRHVSFE